jgi:hypothetical protein
MADDSSASRPAPALVAPSDAISVDGDKVTFVWEPVEGARQYRLQIAPTAQFQDASVDADVGRETAVTVGNQLPTDGQTLFWRVVATVDDEQVASPVESFVATTAAEAEAQRPDEDAEPVTELARAARQEAAVETFNFEDQFEEEKEQGVAYEGVAATQIMGISGSIILVILVAVAIIFGWFAQVTQDERTAAAERQRYEQIRQAETEAERQLRQYGVVDEEEGVYRIPIDRAMDLVATEEAQRRSQESQ